MSKKNYCGSVCLAVQLDFYVSDTEETMEEVKERILDSGFDVTLCKEDGTPYSKKELEIVQMEGELIDEETRGNIKQPYTDSFEICEEGDN